MDDVQKAVHVSLKDLQGEESIPFSTLEDAFGPSSLGLLIVRDLPTNFNSLRAKLLSYASYLAKLPTEELSKEIQHILSLPQPNNHPPDALTDASSNYDIGWSHGKEQLREGHYDTLKGSFYVNCESFYVKSDLSGPSRASRLQCTTSNLWPSECSLPGFRAIFEEFCTLVCNVGALVARACDQHAGKHLKGYSPGYLEQTVKRSLTTKARLLHYFPPTESYSSSLNFSTSISSSSSSSNERNEEDNDDYDSWCTTHVDDGYLTALTSALYVDESIPFPSTSSASFPLLPSFEAPLDLSTGLYVHSRSFSVVKIEIPPDCLAFQTGQALQLVSQGLFRAVPHFVRGPKGMVGESGEKRVARNTLAVFMQPNVDEVVNKGNGMTFGELANIVMEKPL